MFSKQKNAECGMRNAEGRQPSRRRRARRISSSLQPPASSLRRRRRPRRRGVLLLVVLSMLVLFLMIGTAFIITAKQSEKAAKAAQRGTLRLSSTAAMADLLDEVLLQLVRDTNNAQSSLRFHSLLGDMYGNDGFHAQITNVKWADPAGSAANVTNGQMVQFELNLTVDFAPLASGIQCIMDNFGAGVTAPQFLSKIDNAYAGQLLTFTSAGTSASARGVSTRIVGYRPAVTGATPRPATFTIMAFNLADGVTPTATTLAGLAGSRVLINGVPFNGTGFGFDKSAAPASARLSLKDASTDTELALMPYATWFDPYQARSVSAGTTTIDHNFTSSQIEFIKVVVAGLRLDEQRKLGERVGLGGVGGADETYDAADFQNMALGLLVGGAAKESVGYSATADLSGVVLPSFHRPDLLNYWQAALAADPLKALENNALMLRRVLLRPNWLDHPNFNGSNPEYAVAAPTAKLQQMIVGPWDVDNDNDGIRDSVWIDFGAPVMTGPNGKLVKPLAAILCVDLDGRANVNTDGSMDLAGWVDATGAPIPAAALQPSAKLASAAGGPPGALDSDTTPRGVGYGPADKSLAFSLSGGGGALKNFQWLLYGHTFNLPGGTVSLPGRYGHDYDGTSPNPRPGRIGFDLLAQVTLRGWPQWPALRNSPLVSDFGSPPDLRARYGVALNDYGQVITEAASPAELSTNQSNRLSQYGNLAADSPYELDVTLTAPRGVTGFEGQPSAADAPFSLAELEAALRVYDADAPALPQRLALLAGIRDTSGTLAQPAWRNRITTDSVDLPIPNFSMPPELNGQLTSTAAARRLPRSVAELFEMRVQYALNKKDPAKFNKLFPEALGTSETAVLRLAVRRLLSPDLAQGLRMNLNRPLGNGRDDDNNGVVDEPGEVEGPLWRLDMNDAQTGIQSYAGMPGARSQYDNATPTTDPVYTGVVDFDPASGNPKKADPRLMFARHLYVLAQVLTVKPDGLDPGNADDKALAGRLAQWAVNVVDFRDADAIMTGFEYDINPLDGWDVNDLVADKEAGPDAKFGTADDVPAATPDNAQPHRGVVWGTERPELLMNETLAWHDRNTTDEADDEPNPGETAATTDDPTNPDSDFDQLYRPRGAFFLELYNPWPMNPAASGDTHYRTAAGLDGGVHLNKLTPPAAAGPGSPVWRVLITKDVDPSKSPDAPTAANRPTIDRSIYFVKPANLGGAAPVFTDDGTPFQVHDDDADVPPVRPGRFLVVGSGRDETGGVYSAHMGQPLAKPGTEPLRRIELRTDPAVPNPVRVIDNVAADDAVADFAPSTPSGAGPSIAMQAPAEPNDPTIIEPAPSDVLNASVTNVAVINEPRRLTLTEPVGDYQGIVGGSEFGALLAPEPGEEGVYYSGGTTTRKPIDTPLDSDPELTKLGIDLDKGRRLFLQRLANPLAPHDAEANPYRVVDATRAYISVFNGRLTASQTEPGIGKNSDAREGFSSLERGYRETPPAAGSGFDLWSAQPALGSKGLKDVNRGGMAKTSPATYSLRYIPRATFGFLNQPFMNSGAPMPQRLQLVPKEPFPWLTWNNRPFVSAGELMLVPRLAALPLLENFSFYNSTADPFTTPTEDKTPADLANPNSDDAGKEDSFAHLENFVYQKTGAPNNVPRNLYRLLDYVETPSLFVGGQKSLNPSLYGARSATITQPDDPRLNFQPPFNTVSEFRQPGRVNLNTIFSGEVWKDLFHGDAKPDANGKIHPGPALADFAESRGERKLDANFPTMFVNPFRSSAAGDLVPLPTMVRTGVDCTLQRSIDPTPTAPGDTPLFEATTKDPYNHAERNAFFRKSPTTRLPNLVTTRSNVYAVWVTIGFFEVDELREGDAASQPILDRMAGTTGATLADAKLNPLFGRVYPGGYMLGKEDGVDTGDIRRMRAFYIIDRTVPAAFEPGADHNVENVVRLRRRIE